MTGPRPRSSARSTDRPAALGNLKSGAPSPTLTTRSTAPDRRRSSTARSMMARDDAGRRSRDFSLIAWSCSLRVMASPSRKILTPRSNGSLRDAGRGRCCESLWSELEGLRELTGEGLVADDERELEDFRLGEVLTKPLEARIGHVKVVANDGGGEFERRALAIRERGTRLPRREGGELGRGNADSHADGVADVHSVRTLVEVGDMHVEKGAERSIDRTEPLDRAIEASEPEHEWDPMGQDPLRRWDRAEHPLADPVERPDRQAWSLDLADSLHDRLLLGSPANPPVLSRAWVEEEAASPGAAYSAMPA